MLQEAKCMCSSDQLAHSQRRDMHIYVYMSDTYRLLTNLIAHDYLLAELQDPPDVGRTETCRSQAMELHKYILALTGGTISCCHPLKPISTRSSIPRTHASCCVVSKNVSAADCGGYDYGVITPLINI